MQNVSKPGNSEAVSQRKPPERTQFLTATLTVLWKGEHSFNYQMSPLIPTDEHWKERNAVITQPTET